MLEAYRSKKTALYPVIGFKHEQIPYAAFLLCHSSHHRLQERVKPLLKYLLVVRIFPGLIQVLDEDLACELQAQRPPGLLTLAHSSVCPEVLTLRGL